MSQFDHPILLDSFEIIRRRITPTGLSPAEEDVVVRIIHSSGDFSLLQHLRFSPSACTSGLTSLAQGSSIITDTRMATQAIKSMVCRTFQNKIFCILDFAPTVVDYPDTRSSVGMKIALDHYPNSIILVGSSPTALDPVVDFTSNNNLVLPLVIGMPVGFVGVSNSKKKLAQATSIPQIRLEGTRGGAGLAAATLNALLRRAWLDQPGNC